MGGGGHKRLGFGTGLLMLEEWGGGEGVAGGALTAPGL